MLMLIETMDVLVTLFYLLFAVCVIYPPTEFVSAGFTISQLFDNYLGSESFNFVGYHMKRIAITQLIHSALPYGYFTCLRFSGATCEWLWPAMLFTALIPLLNWYWMISWWNGDQRNHPVVKALIPYATETEGNWNWKEVSSNMNLEFRSVDKVTVQLTATSKFVATESWLIKISQCNINVVKQEDCALVATAMDSHNLTESGEDEVQYVNIEAIPSRNDVPRFMIRLSARALRELQPRLLNQVRVPDHLQLQPTRVERFVLIFREHVDENPVYYVDHDLESCIGCMQETADVKLNKRCRDRASGSLCTQCNCRALWCCACMARWWAARAPGDTRNWLGGRGTCPVCRATFCLLDVCPARAAPRVSYIGRSPAGE